MRKGLITMAALCIFGSGATAAPIYETYYGKLVNVSCGRDVTETYIDLNTGKETIYPYRIQENCLKVPKIPEDAGVNEIEEIFLKHSISIKKVDRNRDGIEDLVIFQVKDKEGKLIHNTLYEASGITGKVCSKLLDRDNDNVYDFKALNAEETGMVVEKLYKQMLKGARKLIRKQLKK